MTLQISNVLIWQKNGEIRNLELERNSVNVITGDSGKGKSSILHIIDYCLLSSNAKGISKSNIDDKANWYGVRLQSDSGIITIARPAYHNKEMALLYFSDSGEIPNVPETNMKASTLKDVLNKAFGIDPDLKVPYGGASVKAGSKVSFRHFLPYCYQDQNAIVSPENLYIKPGDTKIQERIERTFRMALGIVDVRGAIVSERLDKLKAERLSLEKKQEALERKRLAFDDDICALEDEAIALGLIEGSSKEPERALEKLEELSNLPADSFGGVSESIERLEKEQADLHRKLRLYKRFNEGYKEYKGVLDQTKDSILPVTYLIDNYRELLPGTRSNLVLQELEAELKAIKKDWEERKGGVLYVDVKNKTKEIEKKIKHNKGLKEGLTKKAASLSSPQEIYRYQGRLSAKLELYSEKSDFVDFSDKLDSLDSKITELESEEKDTESRREFIMGRLNKKINAHIDNLGLKGYEGFEAVFLEKEKSVNLISEDGSKVEKMIDIGSASNYLYLHLAYFMSLHEIARDNHVSWMPAFLILDQVSTPYSGETEDDVKCLDIALEEIDAFVELMSSKGGFQILLLEHIEEKHWKKLGLDNFKLVDKELRGGYGLIN